MKNVAYPQFPSDEQITEISTCKFPNNEFKEAISKIVVNANLRDEEVVRYLLNGCNDPEKWKIILSNKISQINLSYSCAHYYFALGINDDIPYENNFKEGCIDYFPYLTDQNFSNKAMYDFFINNTFYNVFSAFDVIGQILNAKYQLITEIKYVSFNKFFGKDGKLKNLKEKNEKLYNALLNIKSGKAFKTVELRNAFAHRVPPTELVPFAVSMQKYDTIQDLPPTLPKTFRDKIKKSTLINKPQSIGCIQACEYTLSQDLLLSADKAIKCLLDTIKAVHE